MGKRSRWKERIDAMKRAEVTARRLELGLVPYMCPVCGNYTLWISIKRGVATVSCTCGLSREYQYMYPLKAIDYYNKLIDDLSLY